MNNHQNIKGTKFKTNLPVVLSDHVLLRCKQQDINPASVEYRIRTEIPNFSGELKWTCFNGDSIVVKKAFNDKGQEVILVKTVVGRAKKAKSAKHNHNFNRNKKRRTA